MSREAALQYHYNQAKSVEDSLDRILRRLNYLYTPNWLIDELVASSHTIQCIRSERERDLKELRNG